MSETPPHVMQRNNTPVVSVEKMLAAELEKLSLKEREKVYEDVHGVSDVIQESPELIASSLEQLDREIDLIENKDAYEQAKLQSPHLATNRQFLLAFLRCNSFNPKVAALNVVQYFRYKLEMLGTEKLARYRTTLEDIGEAATRILELGSIQVLPNRDSKGRAVIVVSPSVLEPVMDESDNPIPNLAKALWYSMSILFEDEETQQKGVVGVVNMSGLSERHEDHHRNWLWRLTVVGEVLPFRLACLHYCDISASPFSSTLLSTLASAATSPVRVRIRAHNGTHIECRYKLMSFGIPVEEFPFTANGDVQLANHIEWMGRRRKKEEYLRKHPPIEGAVDLPSNYDVLWGKGKQIYRHPGNRLLRELVENYDDEYNRLWKDGKSRLADQIVSVVHGFSGRFMKLDRKSGVWVEVSDLVAREKVTHRFRRNREVVQKGENRHFVQPIVDRTSNETDGDNKRPRMMVNGS